MMAESWEGKFKTAKGPNFLHLIVHKSLGLGTKHRKLDTDRKVGTATGRGSALWGGEKRWHREREKKAKKTERKEGGVGGGS